MPAISEKDVGRYPVYGWRCLSCKGDYEPKRLPPIYKADALEEEPDGTGATYQGTLLPNGHVRLRIGGSTFTLTAGQTERFQRGLGHLAHEARQRVAFLRGDHDLSCRVVDNVLLVRHGSKERAFVHTVAKKREGRCLLCPTRIRPGEAAFRQAPPPRGTNGYGWWIGDQSVARVCIACVKRGGDESKVDRILDMVDPPA